MKRKCILISPEERPIKLKIVRRVVESCGYKWGASMFKCTHPAEFLYVFFIRKKGKKLAFLRCFNQHRLVHISSQYTCFSFAEFLEWDKNESKSRRQKKL